MFNIDKNILKLTSYSGDKEPGKKISASMFGRDLLEIYLRIKYGVIEKFDMGANTFGSLVHKGLESMECDNCEKEYSISIKRSDYDLSATIDLIDHENKVIADYKFVKRYAFEKFDQYGSYAEQLRFSKYILSKEDPKYKDYDMYLIMFIKDFEESSVFKKKEIYPIQYIKVEDTMDTEKKIDLMIEYLNKYIEKDEFPDQCSDLFWRRDPHLNRSVPMKCKKYCSYSDFCPYYKAGKVELEW